MDTTIGTILGVITALLVLSNAVFTFANNRALAKQQAHLARQDKAVAEVHVLVNSQMTQLVQSNLALRDALAKATGIPLDSVPMPGGPATFPASTAEQLATALSPLPPLTAE